MRYLEPELYYNVYISGKIQASEDPSVLCARMVLLFQRDVGNYTSSVMLTGQWSLPITSMWTPASTTFGIRSSHTMK